MLFGCLTPLFACAEQPASANHGVILTYHHVATDTPASTSIAPSQFAAQLEYLDAHGYRVMPLGELVTALKRGRSIPDNAVAITFDDAYQSVFTTARPLLKDRGWPYTVFVNTAAVDAGHAPYMSWDELRTLADEGVEIGNHSHSHAHLPARRQGEPEAAWFARVRADIQQAQARITAELGRPATLFAYPYGEYTRALADLVTEIGMIGFGQHSGAVGYHSDFAALPRFPVGGVYTDLARLAERINTQPLPVKAEPPGPLIVDPDERLPSIALSIPDGPYRLDQLACYASGQGRMQMSIEGPGQVVIKPAAAIGIGRTKYNCTAPHKEQAGVYFWWSYLLMKPPTANSWYDG